MKILKFVTRKFKKQKYNYYGCKTKDLKLAGII